MVHSHRVLYRRVAALATFLWLAFPSPGWTWGGATHHYIAQNYSKHLPPYMDGLRAYDSVVDAKVTDPDERKPTTPGESYRHYIDIDAYPEFFTHTLTHDRSALEARHGASAVLNNGVIPWAVGEVVTTLTQQFRAKQWSAAAVTIADLCHYVGDCNQPLHCTENYDGQRSGNAGIHSRYESAMMSSHIAGLHTPPMAVTYYASAVDEMFNVIDASWNGVSTILHADNAARAASGGSFNSAYYASLWTGTEAMTRARIDTATVVTASLVFSAWVNAGEPTVPGSSGSGGPTTTAATRLDMGPTPFRDQLTIRYAGEGPLSVDVFNVRGALVARLVEGASDEGTVLWQPSSSGRRIGPGLYFVRLAGPNVKLVRRVTLIR